MKLLYIDDNQQLVDSVKNLLDHKYIIDSARTGYDGIEKARLINYSLILLDLGLPDIDGLEVCRKLREADIAAPILVLTVQKDPATCVQLLNSGADDYITKPFNGDALKARVAAILRRSPEMCDEKIVSAGDLTLNVTRRQVWRSGVNIPLRRKEFDILEYLITNQGRALTRAMILNHVWEYGAEAWNNTVDVHIKYLRDKIDRPFATPLIKTAYGIGYKLESTNN